MTVFMQRRSDIDDNLYTDVMDCFEWLEKKGIKIGIVTNGNADLQSSKLYRYLSVFHSSCDLGATKPSPLPFLAALQNTGVCPERVLYIGKYFCSLI